jgi:hypothetical protein
MSANLKQLLLARSDWFAREIMSGVKRSEYAYITPAQSRLLAHMGGKPTSPEAATLTLAQRWGSTSPRGRKSRVKSV